MTGARFVAAAWMPAAIREALDRIETACFTEPHNAAVMREEVRIALRTARDALTDADAAYRSQIEALNTALRLNAR